MTLVGECGNDDGGVWGSASVDGGGGVRSRCGGTGGSRTAPTRFGESGKRLGFGWGCPARRPSGYRLSPVRRWGGAGRRGVLVVGGPLRVPSGQASTGSGRTVSGSGPARRPAPRPSGFAGMGGGVREGRWGCGGRRGLMEAEVPLRRDGRFANDPTTGSGGSDGGRRRPAPRPSGFLPSQECRSWGSAGRTMGGCGGRRGLLVWGEGRLREGCWWRGDGTPRAAPLWVPAFADVPLRRDGRFANRPYEVWGVGEATGVWVGRPARRPSGYRPSPVRRWGGCGAAGGVGRGGAPSSALRTGFDRLRANGVGERPYDGEGGTEAARAAPLWVPAFAGMTLVGECGNDDGGECGNDDGGVWGSARVDGGGGVRVPLRREGRFANRPYDGEWGVRRGTETPRAAPLWVPAFAGMTLVGECGKDDGGCGGRRGLLVAVG